MVALYTPSRIYDNRQHRKMELCSKNWENVDIEFILDSVRQSMISNEILLKILIISVIVLIVAVLITFFAPLIIILIIGIIGFYIYMKYFRKNNKNINSNKWY